MSAPADTVSRTQIDNDGTTRAGHRARLDRLRTHLLGRPLDDRIVGWLGPLLITFFAGILRFVHLGRPHKLIFDETYYVKQAYTLWRNGFENSWPDKADEKFTVGTFNIYLPDGDRAVHPPVGKWMIAAGERIFGIDDAFGWRFASAVVGTLMVLILARVARRMFSSTVLGCTAGLLLAVDGNHLVMSRTGILDIFVAFWALCAFAALVVDRDWARRRLPSLMEPHRGEDGRSPMTYLGPWMLWRPWRLLAALCIGLDIGTKWSGLYFFVAFGLMTVLWDAAALRASGVRRWFLGGVVRNGVTTAAIMVPIVLVVYISSWWGWFRSNNAYLRQWGAEHPSDSPVPDALRSLWQYHKDMYSFHVNLKVKHDYQSNPWSWLIQGRPTSFFYESPKKGTAGCGVEQCSQAITSLGNPLLWWGGAAALLVVLVMWIGARDWRAGGILAGMAGGYLPWFLFQERTIYTFYAVAFVPYLVLALTFALGLLIGDASSSPDRRRIGVAIAGVFVLAIVAVSWFYWPVWVADVIPYSSWRNRMWFPSWI